VRGGAVHTTKIRDLVADAYLASVQSLDRHHRSLRRVSELIHVWHWLPFTTTRGV